TNQSDFAPGFPSNVDLASSPGDVKLSLLPSTSEDQTSLAFFIDFITATNWQAQTFVPQASGQLTQVDFQAARSATGTNGQVIVEIHDTVAGAPGPNVLATTTISTITSTTNAWYTVLFATPANVNAGTPYAIVLKAGSGGPFRAVSSSSAASYANGAWYTTSNGGANWAVGLINSGTIFPADLAFRAFVTPTTYFPDGSLTSAAKDANQPDGTTAGWGTLSWTAAKPAGTDVKFQIAASNSAGGGFIFVGPDGTTATYFTTSGASLSQFNGFRYLKYKAYLTTTNTTVTPTLGDVTICSSNTPLPATSLNIAPATGTYGGTTTLVATLTAGGSPLAGKTVTFKLNGANFGGNTVTTDPAGVAMIPNVSLAGLNAGVYPNYVSARFASDASYAGTSGSNSLTVERANPVVTWDAPAAITYGTPLGAAQLNATANLPGSFVYNPAAGAVLGAGDRTLSVQFSPADAVNYNQVLKETTIHVDKATPTVTANPTTCTYSGSPCEATGTATGVDGTDLGAVTFAYTPGGSAPVNAGDYTVVASIAETDNHTAGTSAPAAVKVNKATPVINWSNPSAI
ncbi:MAG TPA: hypothetical protein VNZ44_07885, partial [Pyrinomonadaceae bacterium]|nr:hypothetical protein [Pyrinomonadaceae bacterium]